MTDTYEARREAKIDRNTAVLRPVLNDLHTGITLPKQSWKTPEGATDLPPTIWSPLDPSVYGFGVLYAESIPLIEDGVVLVRYGDLNSADYVKVEAYQLVDFDKVRGYEQSGFGVRPRDFYSTTVRIPDPEDRYGQKDVSISITGGGVADPERVTSAARVLTIAARIGLAFEAAEGK